MTTLREAAQQALEALEDIFGANKVDVGAITALRAALAQEQAEPVAWMVYTLNGKSVCITDSPEDFTDTHRALPLYTAPPKRAPLTEEEMRSCAQAMDAEPLAEGWPELIKFARAIERAAAEIGRGK